MSLLWKCCHCQRGCGRCPESLLFFMEDGPLRTVPWNVGSWEHFQRAASCQASSSACLTPRPSASEPHGCLHTVSRICNYLFLGPACYHLPLQLSGIFMKPQTIIPTNTHLAYNRYSVSTFLGKEFTHSRTCKGNI